MRLYGEPRISNTFRKQKGLNERILKSMSAATSDREIGNEGGENERASETRLKL